MNLIRFKHLDLNIVFSYQIKIILVILKRILYIFLLEKNYIIFS